MIHNYLLRRGWLAGLLLGLWLLATTTQAQAPTWSLALGIGQSTNNITSGGWDVATDASGNVFVTGYFQGQMTFGSTVLTSLGNDDIFLAKYVPATNTWAWAVRGGGTGSDGGRGVAVSGNTVYLLGNIENNTANNRNVQLGTGAGTATVPQYGAAAGLPSGDLLLMAYTDNGATATLRWSQVAGGTRSDYGAALAVSGNTVYVTGAITNDWFNTNGVVFGGSGTLAGTLPQYGTSANALSNDLLLVAYTDNGPTATYKWSQVGGGADNDQGAGLAVSGASIYITGSISNDLANSAGVRFGGSGTTLGTVPQYGASTSPNADVLLAKYTDQGTSAALNWTQIGGGSLFDQGQGVAVSGTSVYVTGSFGNNTTDAGKARFGGTGTTPGTVIVRGATYGGDNDMLLLKYTDNGATATYRWAQVGGGTGLDWSMSVVASGDKVYLTGYFRNDLVDNNDVVFGGNGTTAATVPVLGVSTNLQDDLLVAGYTDNGATGTLNWTRVGGGYFGDAGRRLSLSGSRLFMTGYTVPAATYGSLTVSSPVGYSVFFLGALDLSGLLATTPAAASSALRLYPNPAPSAATLSGATLGAPVHVFDALGRRVATAMTDATGTAVLPAGLMPGLYVVRAGAATVRWVVE